MNHPLSKSKILEAEPLCLRASGTHISEIDIVKPALAGALKLYVSNNSINTIENIPQFRSLEVLLISNNNISYIEDLEPLSKLKRLKVINIEGNPVCHLPLYKIHLLALCPNLKEIDGRNIVSTGIRKKYSQNDLQLIVSSESALLHSIVSCEIVDENVTKDPPFPIISVQAMIESRYPPDLLRQRYNMIRKEFCEMPTKKYLTNLRSIFVEEHQNILNKAAFKENIYPEIIEKHKSKLNQLASVDNLKQLYQDADELTQIVCQYVEDQNLPSPRSPLKSSSKSSVVNNLYSPLSKGLFDRRPETEAFDDFSENLNNDEKIKNCNGKNKKHNSTLNSTQNKDKNEEDNQKIEENESSIKSDENEMPNSTTNISEKDYSHISNSGKESHKFNSSYEKKNEKYNQNKYLSPTQNKNSSYLDYSSDTNKKHPIDDKNVLDKNEKSNYHPNQNKKKDQSQIAKNHKLDPNKNHDDKNSNSGSVKKNDKDYQSINGSIQNSQMQTHYKKEKVKDTISKVKNDEEESADDVDLNKSNFQDGYEEDDEYFSKSMHDNEIAIEFDLEIGEEEEELPITEELQQSQETVDKKEQNNEHFNNQKDYVEREDEYPDEFNDHENYIKDNANSEEENINDIEQEENNCQSEINSDNESNKNSLLDDGNDEFIKEDEIHSNDKFVFEEEENKNEQKEYKNVSSEYKDTNSNNSNISNKYQTPQENHLKNEKGNSSDLKGNAQNSKQKSPKKS